MMVRPRGVQMSYYVSITGFRPAGIPAIPLFAWRTLRSLAQARKSQGIVRVGAWFAGGTYHTITVWRDKESMRHFMTSGAHRRAMKNFRSLGSGKTYGYSSDDVPDRETAYRLWCLHAKEV